MFYFFYKIIIFIVNKEKDDIRSAYCKFSQLGDGQTTLPTPFRRVGQGFWVYGISGYLILGIRYFNAKNWVLSVTLFLNCGIKYTFFQSLVFYMNFELFLGILDVSFRVYWYSTTPRTDPDLGWLGLLNYKSFSRVIISFTDLLELIPLPRSRANIQWL